MPGEAIGRTYKAHVDGYNMLPYLEGEVSTSPRHEFMYWTDDGDIAGLRYNNWKVVFMEQRAHGFDVWQDPLVVLRFPKLLNLRSDPLERAEHESIGPFGTGRRRGSDFVAVVPRPATRRASGAGIPTRDSGMTGSWR